MFVTVVVRGGSATQVEFTKRHGAVYRPLFHELQQAMRWPEGERVVPELCRDGMRPTSLHPFDHG